MGRVSNNYYLAMHDACTYNNRRHTPCPCNPFVLLIVCWNKRLYITHSNLFNPNPKRLLRPILIFLRAACS